MNKIKKYIYDVFKTTILISVLISGFVYIVYAITWPTNVPGGEVIGGAYNQYFENMKGDCPTNQAVYGFNNDLTKKCLSFGTISIIDGTCGSANGTTVSTKPTTNLCTSGTASSVSGTGPWSWTCNGSGGGINASCSANKSVDGVLVRLGISAFNIYQPVYSTSVFNATMGRMNTAQNLTPGQSCFTILSSWIKPYPWNYTEWSSAANTSGPIRKFSFVPGHANSSGTCIADATITSGSYTWPSGGTQPNAPIDIQPRTCYIMNGTPVLSAFSPTSRTDYSIDTNNYQIGVLVWNPSLYGSGEQYYDCVLPVNGTCGSSNGTNISTVPTTNLCTSGTASSVTSNVGTYTWSCTGIGGGTNASCSAPRQYTVTFNSNGGTTSVPSSKLVTYNTGVGTLGVTSRSGYNLSGWYTSATGGTQVTTSTNVTNNITYYAQWISSYTYSWETGIYGTCSVTCGGGIQTRSVACKRNDGVYVADSYCTDAKPSTSQVCNINPCIPSCTLNATLNCVLFK